MRYMGIDFGTKRVGIALSDENGVFALPKVVIPSDNQTIQAIKKICEENDVRKIVIGESLNYSGEKNSVMKKISEFKDELSLQTGLEIEMEPEFLTSAEAERLQGKNEMLDASAAALILKHYLEKFNKKN